MNTGKNARGETESDANKEEKSPQNQPKIIIKSFQNRHKIKPKYNILALTCSFNEQK